MLKNIWELQRTSRKFSFLAFSPVLLIHTAELELRELHFKERNSITCNNAVYVKRRKKK